MPRYQIVLPRKVLKDFPEKYLAIFGVSVFSVDFLTSFSPKFLSSGVKLAAFMLSFDYRTSNCEMVVPLF